MYIQWGSLCGAFLVEARWFRSGELPTAKEYLENGKVSSGVHIVIVHLFFLLGLGREQHSIHLNDTYTLASSIATILRLYDDLGSAKVILLAIKLQIIPKCVFILIKRQVHIKFQV